MERPIPVDAPVTMTDCVFMFGLFGLLLCHHLPEFRYGHSADSPVVRINFLNNDVSGPRVFVQDVLHQAGDARDDFALLLNGNPLAGDLDVDVRHGLFCFLFISRTRVRPVCTFPRPFHSNQYLVP